MERWFKQLHYKCMTAYFATKPYKKPNQLYLFLLTNFPFIIQMEVALP